MKKLLLICILFLVIKINAQPVFEINSLVCVKSNNSVYVIFKSKEPYEMAGLLEMNEKAIINSFIKDMKKAILEDDESEVEWKNKKYTLKKNKSPQIIFSAFLSKTELTKKEAQQLIDWLEKA
jgi:hypothetical protein